jgi:hypothetical protein
VNNATKCKYSVVSVIMLPCRHYKVKYDSLYNACISIPGSPEPPGFFAAYSVDNIHDQ